MAKPIPTGLSDKVKARFGAKVEIRSEDECWAWLGFCDKKGRGRFSIGGENFMPPRVSLFIAQRYPPSIELFACHTCDNPNCVNPNHLWWGSAKENSLDALEKGRLPKAAQSHCLRGHPLDGDNIFPIKSYRVRRRCKVCARVNRNDWRARMRAVRDALPTPPQGDQQ